jgi:hypothetical protein
MADTVQFDFSTAFKEADQIAAQQDTQASELLWGRIASRVANDEAFRRALTRDPERTIANEAKTLNMPVAPDTVEQIRDILSPAVPGTEQAKVEQLVFGTIEDIRKSFNLTLKLSQLLFYAGVALLVASFVVAVWKDSQTIVAAVFGAGGVASLISSTLMNPLDRIRNAGANLVQLQMVYLAYYKHLYMLGGARELPASADTSRDAKELREATAAMVSTIQGMFAQPPETTHVTSPANQTAAAAPSAAAPKKASSRKTTPRTRSSRATPRGNQPPS